MYWLYLFPTDICICHCSLAAIAGIPKYHRKSKHNLNCMLQARSDFDRLDRVNRRGKLKKLTIPVSTTRAKRKHKECDCDAGGKSSMKRRRSIKAKVDSSTHEITVAAESESESESTSTTTTTTSARDLNTEDPILFEPIGEHCYIFCRRYSGTSGDTDIDIDTDSAPTVPLTATRVAFNIESLVDYLLASGNFRDPVSRIPFTMTDLGEIDELVSLIV